MKSLLDKRLPNVGIRERVEAMCQEDGWPPIGSRWRENDPRATMKTTGREVIAHDKERGRVQLGGVIKTWAKIDRFNGRRGGYTRIG